MLLAASNVGVIEAFFATGAAVLALGLALAVRARSRLARRLRASLEEQERLAVSDGLTGLHNQRFLDEVVKLEVQRARESERPVGVVALNLDGLAEVNRVHGRVAGDRVLVEVAIRLRRTVRPADVLARYGGDEFAVALADADPETVLEIAERCRATIASTPFSLAGREVSVTASTGAACFPDHVRTAAELVDAAVGAAAAAKVAGRNAVRIAARTTEPGDPISTLDAAGVLGYLEAIADEVDRRQGVEGHSLACAGWAGLLADALGLDDATRWRCVAAARLHDIGKVSVPDAILRKAERLTEAEWSRVREHPTQGAQLIALAESLSEIAPIVAEHHERVDGRGFPSGKIGGEIASEARMVAVCDAWAAMLSDRPYRPALSADDARAELLAGSGTQFDAEVVAAFLALPAVRRRSVGPAPVTPESGFLVARRPVG
jgi:diguanylate cyclase (GGDEF)-like protein/putative nucleotidyltransferase with HDIG domain